jgi:putative endopeptidase
MLATAAWQHQRDMAAIGKRTNERRWPVLAQIPDASYDLVENRIVVTAAFLQAPVFDAAAPLERQYGALGALIGHQLHYAFDGKGRSIDADGQFRDWWTPLTSAGYEQRTAPIIAQYDAYPVLGMVKVNGHLTRDENLADLAGVELAYEAFQAASPHKDIEVAVLAPQPTKPAPTKKTASKHAPRPMLVAPPSIDTGFFDAYAKIWARSVTPETAAADVATAIQAPAKYRVDGPLANLPEFGKAYACKSGQPMISATPVSIWR